MIAIPPLTPEILAELQAGFAGCVFDDPHQREFLTNVTRCDVQAAPGNGKTTLIVAKLALLSRSWKARGQGVCVISHTNAARIEVEKRLASHPTASAFLNYPHYIGTVTGFLDQFIALPYLRGLGWSIQRIDDAVFEAVALSRFGSKRTLQGMIRVQNGARKHRVETWIRNLELSPDFVAEKDVTPSRLKIKARQGQSGPHTQSGTELEEVKAELVNAGFFRYPDMASIATQAIEKCPQIVDRLRSRFPLVLLDEAQDTNGVHLALLKKLFNCDQVAFQKLGDQNQTLYEDDELSSEEYWHAETDVIPLNPTRRFGVGIATFASRLTARSAQLIEGVEGKSTKRNLILFDEASILCVMPAYVAQIRDYWGARGSAHSEHWAVASRHRASSDRGNWPKSLSNYCPDYRSSSNIGEHAQSLCSALRESSVLREAGSSPAQILDLIIAGITEFLWCHGIRDTKNKRITKRSLWPVLTAINNQLPLQIRRLIRDHILFGGAAWNETLWSEFCHQLRTALGIVEPFADSALMFTRFDPQGAQNNGAAVRPARTQFIHENTIVKLGSIHSVKGQTVDSILVVETEVYNRGRRVMDLATVLPHAFGLEEKDFNESPAILSAATNVFVGITRPRELLALALRKTVASDQLKAAATDQGWSIVDLTLPH
jgi:DNA helicase-2/ATP-dependent DNA helicase PcrA